MNNDTTYTIRFTRENGDTMWEGAGSIELAEETARKWARDWDKVEITQGGEVVATWHDGDRTC